MSTPRPVAPSTILVSWIGTPLSSSSTLKGAPASSLVIGGGPKLQASLVSQVVVTLAKLNISVVEKEELASSARFKLAERKETVLPILFEVAAARGLKVAQTLQPYFVDKELVSEYVLSGEATLDTLTSSTSAVTADTPAVKPSLARLVDAAMEKGSMRKQGSTVEEPGPRLTCDASYFHGAISDTAVVELLEYQPAGAYIARNSNSNPASCIIISCRDDKEAKKINHFRLWKLGTGRFCLEKNPAAGTPVFNSLQAFVEAHPMHFKTPIERAAAGYGTVDDS